MKLFEKKYPQNYIRVQHHKNNIVVTRNGFINIQGKFTHRGFNMITPEALEEAYEIPEGITFSK